MELTQETLDRIRTLTKKATPGPWSVDGLGNIFRTPHAKDEDYQPVVLLTKSSLDEYAPTEVNATYIATMHPGMALELLDEIERLRGENARLKQDFLDASRSAADESV